MFAVADACRKPRVAEPAERLVDQPATLTRLRREARFQFFSVRLMDATQGHVGHEGAGRVEVVIPWLLRSRGIGNENERDEARARCSYDRTKFSDKPRDPHGRVTPR